MGVVRSAKKNENDEGGNGRGWAGREKTRGGWDVFLIGRGGGWGREEILGGGGLFKKKKKTNISVLWNENNARSTSAFNVSSRRPRRISKSVSITRPSRMSPRRTCAVLAML